MNRIHEPQCPICHSWETVEHALYVCCFHAMILDVMDQAWSPVVQGNAHHTAHTLPTSLSLATHLGVMLWTARAAHWLLWCSVHWNSSVPTFENFVKIWITFVEKIANWQGLSPLTDVFLTFKNTLVTL